jgi:ATP-binding cassette subfamily B multidrug efflux pump
VKALPSLNRFFVKDPWHVGLGFLFVALSNYFGILAPRVVRIAIDFLQGKPSELPIIGSWKWVQVIQSNGVQYLVFLGVIILIYTVIRGILMYFMRQTLIVFSRWVEFDLKNELFNKYTELTLSFFRKNFTGDLMSRIAEDVGNVRMYLGPGIMYIANLVFMFGFVVYAMLDVSPKLTLYVLAPLPILSVAIYLVSKKILVRSTKIQQQLAQITGLAQESFSGIRAIRSFNRQDNFTKGFETEMQRLYDAKLYLVKIEALFFPIILCLIGLSTILTIYLGGIEVMAGRMGAGTVAEFVIYVNMLTWPVASVGWVASLIQQAEASQRRILQFLDEKPDYQKDEGIAKEMHGDVIFDRVSFSYPDAEKPAIHEISFHLKSGNQLGVVGKTGSGKTTLIWLLARLFDVSAGKIIIDGVDLKQWSGSALRKQIGFVPQEPFLFSDTIFNNIALGINADLQTNDLQQKVEHAAKLAEIHETILQFPEGYQTVVGERGVTLSGGQKQRIALARAFISQPKLFVFDDTLSALDTDTEHKILANLQKETSGITTVIIAHRISSVQNADLILVLHEGKMITSGTHHQLIQEKGYYSDLYEKQQKREEIQAL